jgi:hypothetical protein
MKPRSSIRSRSTMITKELKDVAVDEARMIKMKKRATSATEMCTMLLT